MLLLYHHTYQENVIWILLSRHVDERNVKWKDGETQPLAALKMLNRHIRRGHDLPDEKVFT